MASFSGLMATGGAALSSRLSSSWLSSASKGSPATPAGIGCSAQAKRADGTGQLRGLELQPPKAITALAANHQGLTLQPQPAGIQPQAVEFELQIRP